MNATIIAIPLFILFPTNIKEPNKKQHVYDISVGRLVIVVADQMILDIFQVPS